MGGDRCRRARERWSFAHGALRAFVLLALGAGLIAAGCSGSEPVEESRSAPAEPPPAALPAGAEESAGVDRPEVGSAPTPIPPDASQPGETGSPDELSSADPPAATLAQPVALAPPPGPASPMLVGFHDDRAFLYLESRASSLEQARELGTTVLRTYVVWNRVAPTRPANAADHTDPAYDWTLHDVLVRDAHERGVRVLMTIWATPDWANEGRGDSAAPTDLQDLVDFSFALASRYSGAVEGIPEVQLFSLWNEPNLNRFLSPQFDENGLSVAPATYAAMYRAAHLGLKAANDDAQVAMLEVSPRGRDRPGERPTRDSHSPGRFAQLVAEACGGQCEFDAIAWHPYTPSLGGSPSSKVRWPNANLPELHRFALALETWFDLPAPPRLWITEYGHQTNPPREGGVTFAEQADYLEEAIRLSNESGLVDMFVWFIYHDDPASPPGRWEAAGGLIDRDGQPKPSLARLQATLQALAGS